MKENQCVICGRYIGFAEFENGTATTQWEDGYLTLEGYEPSDNRESFHVACDKPVVQEKSFKMDESERWPEHQLIAMRAAMAMHQKLAQRGEAASAEPTPNPNSQCKPGGNGHAQ